MHVVFTVREGFYVPEIVKAWKGYTSKELNKIDGRAGTVWQEDYFDRAIRNERHLRRTVDYVVNNPAIVGLVEWKYLACYPERIGLVL